MTKAGCEAVYKKAHRFCKTDVYEVIELSWQLQRAMEELTAIALSGVEFDHPGMSYVTVQIDRRTWEAAKKLVREWERR
jgi:hypothetical protein